MGKRREGREAAIQFLFQRDLNSGEQRESLAHFWEIRTATEKTRGFANALIHGVIAQQPAIDERITAIAANYQLDRIAAVDRNILRVAIYEMLFTDDVPPVVSINEAIEIAKRFGSEDSGRFVNGILDKVRKEIVRPLR
ncbi:MAG: transcription antitermination protein NusB [Chthoniobacter sp.]|jgi:N utilization substance protein B|nr:transcription antitermination protein NusB [Chthoniobacter sp.]